jgi:hypothetical protein
VPLHPFSIATFADERQLSGCFGMLRGSNLPRAQGRRVDTLLQILSVHLFEKAPLAQVLAGPDYTLDDTHVRNQLRLFDF